MDEFEYQFTLLAKENGWVIPEDESSDFSDDEEEVLEEIRALRKERDGCLRENKEQWYGEGKHLSNTSKYKPTLETFPGIMQSRTTMKYKPKLQTILEDNEEDLPEDQPLDLKPWNEDYSSFKRKRDDGVYEGREQMPSRKRKLENGAEEYFDEPDWAHEILFPMTDSKTTPDERNNMNENFFNSMNPTFLSKMGNMFIEEYPEKVYWFIVFLFSTGVLGDENVKNHRLERRQDNSFLFGGWRPIRPKNPYLHGSATGRYHDLLSALPDSLDTSSSYYTHALPKVYNKDIYNYYPRPAIKPKPKKNTPIYMEVLKPQQQKNGGRGYANGAPQLIDIQNIDLGQIRSLQEAILKAKDQLPLSHLTNIPIEPGKQFEIIEVSLQDLQQSGHQPAVGNIGYGSRLGGGSRSNKGKGGYGRVPQSFLPAQLPLQYQYVKVPKFPLQVPHSIPSLEEVVGIKDIQIVEVPVPAPLSYGSSKGKQSQYGKRRNRPSQLQYRVPTAKNPSFPVSSYPRLEQSQKYFPLPQQPKSNYVEKEQQVIQPQVEAEIVKLSEHEINHLLKNLQVLDKNSHDLLKYLPVNGGQKGNGEDLHLIVALPQTENQGSEKTAYDVQAYQSQPAKGNYGKKIQYDSKSYATPSFATISQNSGGYKLGNNEQVEHNAAGYQIEDQGRTNGHQQPSYGQNDYGSSSYGGKSQKGGYAAVNQGYSQAAYEAQDEHQQAGYGQERQQAGYGQGHQQAGYGQDGHQQAGYGQDGHQQAGYGQDGHQQAGYGQDGHQQAGYGQDGDQQAGYGQDGQQQYIQVLTPHTGASDYRREPVLALEIKHGQSVEEAIQTLDPETLQKLGAHGKEGLEIEVVEIPLDEYSSESKKVETIVSSDNSTVTAKPTTTTKKPEKKA
ncbi:uncharacterized protein LOC129217764 [Uloborus diversus]|uniref:uncharacterized protein LOC129217764 n=1 Tax=Uloborus diversus TaxID=327109 RepID=UPI00240A69E9|nr:uncharacterized protein LOC129217764 [Uloborus diversus]